MKKPSPKKLKTIRKKAGMSNAFRHKDIASKDFAGSNETYPVNTAGQYKSLQGLVGHAPKNKQAGIKAKAKKIAKRKGFISDSVDSYMNNKV